MNGTSEDGQRKQRKGQRTLTEKRTNNFKYMHLKEDRPLLSKRRTQEYWKVVAGVVVLHRQPLPSVWVVLLRNLPTPPPHPTLQYPSLPPDHHTSLINVHSFFIKLFYCPTPFPLGCNPRNPPCRPFLRVPLQPTHLKRPNMLTP